MVGFDGVAKWSRYVQGLVCLLLPSLAWGTERIQLSDTHQVGDTQRVKVVMEARGQIRAADGKTTYPLSATAQAVYQERWYSVGPTRTTIRSYEKSLARLKVGDSRDEVTLPDHKQMLVIHAPSAGAPSRYALDGHLSRRELDAVRIPGDSIFLAGMLPKEPVQVGDMWVPDADALAEMVQLDEVTGPEVRCRLLDVDRGLAKVQFSGQLVGRADGATSGIELSGELRCDVGTQRVRWLQLKIQEDRDAGPASPAFKAVAEVRMLVESLPAAEPTRFPAEVPVATAEASWLEFQSSEGGFRFLHEPNWTVVDDQAQKTILRWMEDGRVFIQCNISRLQNLAAGKQLGLEELQSDIRKSFGDKFGEFESARQDTRRDGTQMLRVVANGEVDGGRVLWVFCHLASKSGDRVSLILTMDAASSKQYQQADQLLVESLQFLPPSARNAPPSPAADAVEDQARMPADGQGPRR